MSFGEQLELGAALLRAKLFRRHIPLYVQFSVTNRCNLRCVYCNIPNLESRDLTFGQIERMTGDLWRLGTRRIVLLGGEPLLRTDIGAIIRLLKRRGMFVGVVTNGVFVPARIDELREADTVSVSLDGDEAVNDANRGKGTYRKAIAALEALASSGVTRFVSATLVRSNVSSVGHILDVAAKFSCKAIINLAYHANVISCTASSHRASDAEYRHAIGEIIRLKRQGAPILLSEATYRYVRDWPDLSEDRIKGSGRPLPPRSPECQAGRLYCYIDANGDVFPCALWAGEREALNVDSDGVGAAWSHCRGHGCRACSVACFVEYNAIFSLQPGTLLNTARYYKR